MARSRTNQPMKGRATTSAKPAQGASRRARMGDFLAICSRFMGPVYGIPVGIVWGKRPTLEVM